MILEQKSNNVSYEVFPISFSKELENNKVLKLKGQTFIFPADPDKGFNCEYSLFIPDGCQFDTTLLMYGCNTASNVPIHLEDANRIARDSTTKDKTNGMWLGYDLKMPVLTPLFPRVEGYYTQALGSQVLHNDVSTLIADQERRKPEDRLSLEEISKIQEQCKDMPGQLVNMIKSSRDFLNKTGIKVDEKVIAAGYSAGSKFANGFTALHPEMVKGLIAGGASGLGILPLKELNGQTLNYPLGVADITNFNEELYKSIPQLYYIGNRDQNDPAMVKCNFEVSQDGSYVESSEFGGKKPLLDVNGNVIPKLDSNGEIQARHKENYTQSEIIQIHTLLGSNPQTRFDNSQKLYTSLGVNAEFKKLDGDHNSVSRIENGISVTHETEVSFIKSVLAKEKKKSFDQRTSSEIQIAQKIREKNKLISQQKKKENKPKILVKKNINTSSTNKGYIDTVILSLIVSFVAGMLSMAVYFIIK